ncbi:major histocompatibility complex class I-related protein 1-like [Alosa pseudoharengus]|uniref:major histocompatibility complex class I-related protein 1-like n=1 Tax=Alosa pseudoharengus TaxID=34774 RepID=UPI003F886F8C
MREGDLCEGITTRGQDVVEGTIWKDKEICETGRVMQKFLIPEDKVLKVADEHVFQELAEVMCFVISTDDVVPLAESSKNIADGSHPTEFADYSNLMECVTLTPCDFTLLQLDGEGSSCPRLTDTVIFHLCFSGTHHLQYLYTATSGIPDFPEFTTVGIVNAEPISYYDSNIKKSIHRQEWMEQMDPDYWESETNVAIVHHQTFKMDIQILGQRFNHTGGVHVLQKMYGCQWNDETIATLGYEMFGYDGEDFLVLDLKNMRWNAAVPQAVLSKKKWDEGAVDFEIRKIYFNQMCVEWLKKYVAYGSSTLGRKVPPEVSLFQKYPSVVCHATGFYPDGVNITWKRDGVEMQDVNVGETLPNDDGTFQKRAVLRVSPEEMKKSQHTCDVAHKSGETIVKTLIVEDGKTHNLDSIIIGIIIGCLALVISVIMILESVIQYGMQTWYGNLTVQLKSKLGRLVKTALKIVGHPDQGYMQALYEKSVLREALKIVEDHTHILHEEFALLPSGRRFRVLNCWYCGGVGLYV